MPLDKQFDVDEALDQAMYAFWSKGYDGTSVQDLVTCMGINRGSLYDTFGSKRGLFVRALRRYETTYQRRRKASAAEGRGPRETIETLFRSLVDEAVTDARRGGCFMVNTGLDVAPHDAEIGRIVADGLRGMEEFFRTTIERGKEAGEIPGHVDAVEASRGLLGLMIGIRVLARSRPERAVLESIVARGMAMLA